MQFFFDDQVSYISQTVSSLSLTQSVSKLMAYFDSLAEVRNCLIIGEKDPNSLPKASISTLQSPVDNQNSSRVSLSSSTFKDDCDLDSLIAQFVPRERRVGHINLSGLGEDLLPDADSISTPLSTFREVVKSSKSVFSEVLTMFNKKSFFPVSGFHRKELKKAKGLPVEPDLQEIKSKCFPSVKRVSSFRRLHILNYDLNPTDIKDSEPTRKELDFSATKAFKHTLSHENTVPQSNLAFSDLPGQPNNNGSRELFLDSFAPPPKFENPVLDELQSVSSFSDGTSDNRKFEPVSKSWNALRKDIPRQSLGSLFDLYDNNSGSPTQELDSQIFSPNTHKPGRGDVPSIEERQNCQSDATKEKGWEKLLRGKLFHYGPSVAISPYETGFQSDYEHDYPFSKSTVSLPTWQSKSTISRLFGINQKRQSAGSPEKAFKTGQGEPNLRKSVSDDSLQYSIRGTIHKLKSSISSGRKRSLSLHVRFSSPKSTPTEATPCQNNQDARKPQSLRVETRISGPSSLIDVVNPNDQGSEEFFSAS